MALGYGWMMFEIMFFYMLIAFIVCYFFRKHCQDPKIIKEAEEKEEREEEEERLKMEQEGITLG